MIKSWKDCKNILIIRPDNMGDLIMSGPAIRALKETFRSRITVLTSSMGAGIVPFIPEIDDVIVYDLPWVKAKEVIASEDVFDLVQQLKERKFDAAVIFTVFSQNPLPSAMIAFMAGIALRLSYCRENPYHLLTEWVPDKEPYNFIQHQVQRDLQLVQTVGASTNNSGLYLQVANHLFEKVQNKLIAQGIDTNKPWIIFHAGVSEKKREYPVELWVKAAQKLMAEKGMQVLFTGAKSERELCNDLTSKAGNGAYSVAGHFSLEEFIALVKAAPAIVSVNTGTVHIAAAVNTPVVVLYAQTNPQHFPWMVPHKVLEFGVDENSRSKNEVIQFLYKEVYKDNVSMPLEDDIVEAVEALLTEARPNIKFLDVNAVE